MKSDVQLYDWSLLLSQTVFSVSYEFEAYETIDDVSILPFTRYVQEIFLQIYKKKGRAREAK